MSNTFDLTDYHHKIAAFARESNKPFCIKAGPGSGKTTTLFTIIIPAFMVTGKESGAAIAFNTKNAKDFETVNRWPNQILCATIHAFCLRLLKAKFPFIRVNAPKKAGKNFQAGGRWEKEKPGKVKDTIARLYPDCSEGEANLVARLVSLGQNNAFGIGENPEICISSFRELMDKYTINQPDGEDSFDLSEVAYEVFKDVIENVREIDFGDMPYFILKYGVELPKLDFLCFDEAQDMFPIILELLAKMSENGTRIIAVGDPNQAINRFAGSMDSAIDNLSIRIGADCFTLPVSYRCCNEAVNLANGLIPGSVIQWEGAKAGSIERITMREFDCDSLDNAALIVGRFHKFLVPTAYSFMKKGRKFRYKGIKAVAGQMNRSLFFATKDNNNDLTDARRRLIEFIDEKEAKIPAGKNMPQWLKTLKENIETLCELIAVIQAEGGDLKTVKKYLDILAAAEENTEGPTISSIHACKGSQSDNLFLVGPLKADMPNMKEEERQSELYAEYVAYTRGSDKITFVTEGN